MSSLMTGVLNELKSENQRLENELIFINKCLKVLFKFKTNLFEILNSRTSSETICLTSEDIQLFKDIDEEYTKVLTEEEKVIKLRVNKTEELSEIQNNKIFKNCFQLNKDSNNEMIDKTDGNVAKEVNRRKTTTNVTKEQMKTVNEKHIIKNQNKNESSINELSDWIQLSDNQLIKTKKTYGKRVNNLSEQQKTSQILNSMNSNPIQPMVWSTVLTTIRPQTIVSNIESTEECNNDYKQFKCKFCGRVFNSNLSLNSHNMFINCNYLNEELSERLDPSLRTDLLKQFSNYCRFSVKANKQNERLKCDINNCEFSYEYRAEYWSHLKDSHKDYKPIKCEFCDKRFLTIALKKTHLNSVHSEKTYKCDFEGCDRSFRTKCSLKVHIKCVHSHINNRLKCDFKGCDKEFRFIINLNIHKKSHLNNYISCNWPGCQYTTNTPNKLRTHTTTHSNVRNFMCDWPECGKAFKIKRHLKEHHRIHTNEKPYACEWPGCEYRCVTYSNFLVHKRVHNKR